ncbi:hypothetical protein PAPYR_3519 [Paratrimastix pyriformis]|uniref:C2H2-type domain-containing protein n=1 Tax=Paratrimastix pyriformis TaxID=342808 RepID=A0ABQ8UQZ6_9EUKA|nr:hypothetical protein PAPYR_3519 [Paratrimastix pyriformis]
MSFLTKVQVTPAKSAISTPALAAAAIRMHIGRIGVTNFQSALLTECYQKERSLATKWQESFHREQAQMRELTDSTKALGIESPPTFSSLDRMLMPNRQCLSPPRQRFTFPPVSGSPSSPATQGSPSSPVRTRNAEVEVIQCPHCGSPVTSPRRQHSPHHHHHHHHRSPSPQRSPQF